MSTIAHSPRRLIGLVVGLATTLLLILSTGSLIENLEANKVMIIQSLSGDLHCHIEPGPKAQLLGNVTKYPRRGTYSFNEHTEKTNTGKPLQFNDGGKATLYGSVNWEMPADCKQILRIHRDYGSTTGVEDQAIARMVNSAVYLSGPMMSSTESAAEKRGMLVDLINDQAQHGVYQTVTRLVEQADSATGEKRYMNAVEIVKDAAGHPRRQQGSILETYGLKLQPMSIESLVYSKEVEAQIGQRQNAIQQVRLAQENARKAQQDAITAEENGKAKAAEAKWTQEAIKAKMVTEAESRRDVAKLDAEAAANYKKQQILIGEGDAERRRLVLNADGALDAKLEAYKKVMADWAGAFGQFKGTMVPQINMGGGAAGSNATAMNGTHDLINMLSAKTARDLALDLSNAGTAQTVKK